AVSANLTMLITWLKEQTAAGADTMLTNVHFLAAFTKCMSASPTDRDFVYLNENEWRIIHSYSQQEAGRIRKTEESRPEYLIPFTRQDVEMLVVPDGEVRSALACEPDLLSWAGGADLPPMLTVQQVQ